MFEIGLSIVVVLQLFFIVDDLVWGIELFGLLLLIEDIFVNLIVYRDFCVEILYGLGIGVMFDFDKIDFFC